VTARARPAPRRPPASPGRRRVAQALGLGVAWLALPRPARAADAGASAIAVLVPEVSEPYREVFAKMVEGIEASAPGRVRTIVVASGALAAEVEPRLKAAGARAVIALGRQGLRAMEGLEERFPVIVGGVMLLPDAQRSALAGISLSPDPALLFARLAALQSAVRRVLVVYDPRHNDWLMRLAREAARAQGLELVAVEARDLPAAAKAYDAFFAQAEGPRDAVWLPQDPTTAEEGTILPLVLKESWNRRLPLFSSSYPHVKKGALFVLYPDNLKLGRDLGSVALRELQGEALRGVQPLREVLMGVNLRTAGHLGLRLDDARQRAFDSVFPEE